MVNWSPMYILLLQNRAGQASLFLSPPMYKMGRIGGGIWAILAPLLVSLLCLSPMGERIPLT